MKIDISKQIQAILEFRFFDGTGPLSVTRYEIEKYVEVNGLPKSSPKFGELGYEYKNGVWVVSHYEKNINIGSNSYESELEALEVILDHSLPSYKRNNA
jgi:hypothetical protein